MYFPPPFHHACFRARSCVVVVVYNEIIIDIIYKPFSCVMWSLRNLLHVIATQTIRHVGALDVMKRAFINRSKENVLCWMHDFVSLKRSAASLDAYLM